MIRLLTHTTACLDINHFSYVCIKMSDLAYMQQMVKGDWAMYKLPSDKYVGTLI